MDVCVCVCGGGGCKEYCKPRYLLLLRFSCIYFFNVGSDLSAIEVTAIIRLLFVINYGGYLFFPAGCSRVASSAEGQSYL